MKKPIIFFIFVFIFFHVVFNFGEWKELLSKNISNRISMGDSSMAEFILENNYQNIIKGKSPFILEHQLFYPFSSINISMNDPSLSNVIFSFFLRPFLNPHKNLLAILLINIFLNNLLMFFLLKKINIIDPINLVISLVFGYLPIVPYRILGHYTYTAVYVFPLIFLLIINIYREKQLFRKILLSFIFGLTLTFILLLNFYYFIGIFLMFAGYIIYQLILDGEKLKVILLNNLVNLFFVITSFFISISFWILSVFKLINNTGVEKTNGFAGAIELSGDMMGLFTPSEFNPIFKYIVIKLVAFHYIFLKLDRFFSNNIEKFNYGGLILIISFLTLIIFKKNISMITWNKIKPHLYISLMFAFLTLGPFLKVFNRWLINLEGVSVVFPLPFLLLRYIPGLSSIRAPTRFTPLFIFLGLIVSSYLLNYFYRKNNIKQKAVLFLLLITIFIVDQFIIFPKRPSAYFPITIYRQIEKLKQGTVLEIPFTVRDGFRYIGDVHAIGFMNGQLIHKKPVIGGYMARVDSNVFDYYQKIRFINYISKIIDKSNYYLLKEKPKEVVIVDPQFQTSEIAIELKMLDIKYIVLKNDEKYSKVIEDIIKKIDYKKTKVDGKYNLYQYERSN